MYFWVFQSINAIAFGSLLFMIASGFSLIFGLMDIVNLTHAIFYMMGSYIGYTVFVHTGSFFLAIITAGVVVSLIGGLKYRFFLQNLHGKPLNQVLLCLGFLFVFDDLLLIIFGGDSLIIDIPDMLRGATTIGNIYFPNYRLFLILIGLVLIIILHFLIEKTKIGSLIRAGVDDEEMVRAMGININRIFLLVYILGIFLAAMGGVFGGVILGMQPRMAFSVLPLALVVVIIGGKGNIKGAYFGSIVVAFLDNFGRALFPELSYFTLFLPMVLILTFKPEGLFGKSNS